MTQENLQMRKPRQKSIEIREYILENVYAHPQDIASLTAARFKITRPAVLRHVKKLISEGVLAVHGVTRDRRYELLPLVDEDFSIALSPNVEEDKIWRHLVLPILHQLPANVMSICEYGITEIVNNAIDHSEGTVLEIHVKQSAARIEFTLKDDGIGIFNKIWRDLHLGEPREAILELSKGKVTTDPERHTGEGIFFVSRMFDRFAIASGGLLYTLIELGDDFFPLANDSNVGTTVKMSISTLSKRTVQSVFDQYASEDFDYIFSKTEVPVALARLGNENLVSRSQARRLLSRLGEFQSIKLDFGGVESIGQPFADEIFRVYVRNHPEAEITSVNSSDAVERMIRRVSFG